MSHLPKRPSPLSIVALALIGLMAATVSHRLHAQPVPGGRPLMPQPGPGGAQQAANAVPNPTSLAELKDLNDRVIAMVAKVRPAVVQVSMVARVRPAMVQVGTGVVVSADGLVMCVAHLGVRAGQAVTFVFPDGRRARGVTLGNDKVGDAGMMRITDRGTWPHVDVAKPEDIKLGEWCVALGYPTSFDQQRHPSVRLGRVYQHDALNVSSDCTIMGGDSGGPLFDLQGRVIGINSTCGDSLLENHHVAIDRFQRYWDRLLRGDDMDELEPGQGALLGVHSDPDVAAAKIAEVTPDGAAAKAGFKVGDVVNKFAGKQIRTFQDLIMEVRQHKPGEKVDVELHRGEEVLKISVTLGKAETK